MAIEELAEKYEDLYDEHYDGNFNDSLYEEPTEIRDLDEYADELEDTMEDTAYGGYDGPAYFWDTTPESLHLRPRGAPVSALVRARLAFADTVDARGWGIEAGVYADGIDLLRSGAVIGAGDALLEPFDARGDWLISLWENYEFSEVGEGEHPRGGLFLDPEAFNYTAEVRPALRRGRRLRSRDLGWAPLSFYLE